VSTGNATLSNVTVRQKRQHKYPDDPMVTVDPTAVRAAIETSDLSLAEIAARLGRGENRQTIHAMTRGEQAKRCRRSRRQKLARALDVPEAWLSGEWLRPQSEPLGGLASFAVLLISFARSPRVSFAFMRLSERVSDAARGDSQARGKSPDQVTEEVIGLVSELASPDAWRSSLLATPKGVPWAAPPKPMRPGIAGAFEWVRLTPDEEEATLSTLRVLTFALEPWLNGSAQLRLDQLRAIAALVAPPPAKPPVNVPNVRVGTTRPRKPQK
jgi:hypothetical protein